jgi:hypothetical protein
MLSFCEDVGVASCTSHILCSDNLTLGSMSSVYPDSVNGQRHSTDCSIILISSYSTLRRHLFTNSGMILDNRSLHPHIIGREIITERASSRAAWAAVNAPAHYERHRSMSGCREGF